jgi:shikimate 5-dehydrogenase
VYVLDLALQQAPTGLMRDAKAHGGTVANGQVSFLAAQAAAFTLWTQAEAPNEVLKTALRDALGGRGGEETGVAGD